MQGLCVCCTRVAQMLPSDRPSFLPLLARHHDKRRSAMKGIKSTTKPPEFELLLDRNDATGPVYHGDPVYRPFDSLHATVRVVSSLELLVERITMSFQGENPLSALQHVSQAKIGVPKASSPRLWRPIRIQEASPWSIITARTR
jgi:hypothetical protein